jgi:hypothetical protein
LRRPSAVATAVAEKLNDSNDPEHAVQPSIRQQHHLEVLHH